MGLLVLQREERQMVWLFQGEMPFAVIKVAGFGMRERDDDRVQISCYVGDSALQLMRGETPMRRTTRTTWSFPLWRREAVHIPDRAKVALELCKGKSVKLTFELPEDVSALRGELIDFAALAKKPNVRAAIEALSR